MSTEFSPIKIEDYNIVLPEGYMKMFFDMESLKSFIVGRMTQEVEGIIRTSVMKQMKDIDYYES
jgi:hypothetical protein